MTGSLLKFAEDYTAATDETEIIFGEPMREHTSFQIGGSAQVFARVYSEEALAIGLELCRRYGLPRYILGKGTNLLVSDKGLRGVVFDMTTLAGWKVEGTRLWAAAGTLLRQLGKAAAKASLTGLEFAHGIPGTLGGALFMNAGAYGGEMKDITESVRIMGPEGRIRELDGAEMAFGYRSSRMEGSDEVIVSAVLRLEKGEAAAIEERMRELSEKRREKQPLTYPSAGSTFKRPPGRFAGQLIEEAGLKGFQIGGAQVSEKHAGFVINAGGASARDVEALCREVIRRVEETSGVTLEREVRLWGEF
ncbi:MAG: UDP-N-acetylmuramate dehydrogenase [Lachnospiraceae bacterium]|nr:UDP-N-acetylmuramate dehydrogenase [Lachnospiraceae bacterium]